MYSNSSPATLTRNWSPGLTHSVDRNINWRLMDNSVKDPQVAATLSKIRQMTEHTEALQQLWAALCISDELPHKRQFAIWLMDNDYSKRMAKDGNSGKLMANHGKSLFPLAISHVLQRCPRQT